MPENRYYIDQDLAQDKLVSLPKDELKHLRVLRKSPGDTIELVNGQHTLAEAILKTPDTAQIISIETHKPPKKQVILAQALLRSKNLDLVIEKGTELGATTFWLFPGEKSEKKGLSENQTSRLHHLTVSALKQCGRLDLPQIDQKPPLSEWTPQELPLLYGSPTSKTPLTPSDAQIIVIGPESGLSLNEITHLERLNAKDISLGPNTLRAETAAICALSKIF